MSTIADPHPGRMLLHLVLVVVVSACMTSPETVLTQLIVKTLLTAVTKSHHALRPTERTRHRMID